MVGKWLGGGWEVIGRWSGYDWDSDLFLEDLVTMVYGSNQNSDDHSGHAHH